MVAISLNYYDNKSMVSSFKKIGFFYRTDVKGAAKWEERLRGWLKKNSPKSKLLIANHVPRARESAPNLLVVLGGDGTILEASQKYQKWNPIIFGLNLGHVGFLASVREAKDFLTGLKKVTQGDYRVVPKMMIKGTLFRNGKPIYSAHTLNEMVLQSLFSTVSIKVSIDNHPVQYIKGTGVLVSTATGSTAYNLSAHGPIVMPDIKCFVITELSDHNIPTPSLVVKRNRKIELTVLDYRKRDEFLIVRSGKKADVVMAADSENIVPVIPGDKIIVERSPRLARFAELDKNYFFKSIEEKFGFR